MNLKWYFLFCIAILQSVTVIARSSGQNPGPKYYYLEDSTRSLRADQALKAYVNGHFSPLSTGALNPGFTNSDYWLVLELDSNYRKEQGVFVIDNAHINEIQAYYLDSHHEAALTPRYVTGDFHPFAQRPIQYNTFAFPLRQKTTTYLFKIDKHFESLQAPFYLTNYARLLASVATEELLNGIFTGILILIVLFGLFLFLNTREKVYLNYAGYVLVITLWILSNKGIGFHYLWPNSHFFPSRARPLFAMLNIVLMIGFLQSFIQQPRKSWFFIPLKILQYFALIICLVIICPVEYTRFGQYSNYVQHTMSLSTLALVALFLGSIVEKIRQGSRPALLYLVATVVLLCFAMLESLYHLGKVNLPYLLAHYGMFIGVVLEMVIITLGLTMRFNQYRKEKLILLEELNQQQAKLTDTIVAVQEQERKEIADRLHDEIGAMLSVASLQIDSLSQSMDIQKLYHTRSMMNEISNTVRNISHQLTPIVIEKYGLRKAITDLVDNTNLPSNFKVEAIIIGLEEPMHLQFQFTVYRIIQELVQNAIKHAKAKNVLLQVVEHEDAINIEVTDNGQGVADFENKKEDALFLRSVRAKVAYLHGIMETNSSQPSGMSILIEIPKNY